MTAAAPPDWRATLRGAVRPPLRQRRFWVVQVLVILLVALHAGAALGGWLRPLGIPAAATLPLLLLPVLYASLNFGLPGSLATAAWVTALMIPTLALSDAAPARWVDAGQLLALDAVAAFVGQRIAREGAARWQAAAAARAHQLAEARYRALFGSNHAPILVTDAGGSVAEANPAAVRLFGRDPRGLTVAALLGPGTTAEREGRPGAVLTLQGPDGAARALRVETTTVDPGGAVRQVVLQDITGELRDQHRVQSYAARVVNALEEERRQLAEVIHDEALQMLIHLGRRLEGLAGSPSLPPDTGLALIEAARQAMTISSDLRTLVQGLRPSVLDDLGLVAALPRLGRDVERTAGIPVTMEMPDRVPRWPTPVELACYRIAQEALGNVAQHARATRAVVRLQDRGGQAHLLVADDGVGFRVPPTPEAGQLGLVGMTERATGLGGRVRMRSSPGRGTVVALTLPARAPGPGAGVAGAPRPVPAASR